MGLQTSTQIKIKVGQSVKNCWGYNSVKLGSDHKIVNENFKIHFSKFKQTSSDKKKTENLDTGQQYQLELKNRFDAFTEVDHPETMYKDIVEIVAESAQKVISNMPKRRSKKLVSDTTLTLLPIETT